MFQAFEVAVPKTRTIELENGNKLNLTITDPYGFIHLHLERGQLPDSLKDVQYTDWHHAEIAAKKYVAQRQDVLTEIKIKEPTKKAS